MGELVDARLEHFATDGKRLVFFLFLGVGHENDIFVLKGHIGRLSADDGLQIERDDLHLTVFTHTLQHGARGECGLGQAVGIGQKLAHGACLFVQLVHSGAEHGALQFDHVLVAHQHRIDEERVAIGHREIVHVVG